MNGPKKCGACGREHAGTPGDNAWAMIYLGIQHDDTRAEMLGPLGVNVCGPECTEAAIDGLVDAAHEALAKVRPEAKA